MFDGIKDKLALKLTKTRPWDVLRWAATGQWQLFAERLDAAAADAEIPDRRLALMFACAHPAIEAGIRAPLMLQVVPRKSLVRFAAAFHNFTPTSSST